MTDEQKNILDCNTAAYVVADAGTGKTTTMIEKIIFELDKKTSNKKIAAITFTNSVNDEIKLKLGSKLNDVYISTMNSFVSDEIIKPFAHDVFSEIDPEDQIQTDFNCKFMNFNEGLNEFKNTKTIGELKNYNEDFVFKLAKFIFLKSMACRRYLKCKYFLIMIDEAQDCSKDTLELIKELLDKTHIQIIMIGDDDQNIYAWRGSIGFIDFCKKENLKSYKLTKNFRSTDEIQNIANLFNRANEIDYFKIKDHNNVLCIQSNNDNWVESLKKYMDMPTAILRPNRIDLKYITNILNKENFNFNYIEKPPVLKIYNKFSWFYQNISSLLMDKRYGTHSFYADIPNDYKNKDKKQQMFQDLSDLKGIYIKEHKVSYNSVCRVAEQLSIDVDEKDFEKLKNSVECDDYQSYYHIDTCSRISLTIHFSKGLEYDQVILFCSDFRNKNDNDIYVALTRAKKRLILIRDMNSKQKDDLYMRIENSIRKKGLDIDNYMKRIDASTS